MAGDTFFTDGIFWRRFICETSPALSGEGNGPCRREPILIIHGLFGSGDNWQSHGRALAEHRDVLVPDVPNHGQSKHISDMSYPVLASLIWEALDEIGIGNEGAPLSILGHSMGGKIAMAMSFQRPSAIRSLLVADIAPRKYPSQHDVIFDAMERVSRATPANRSEAEQILARSVADKAVRLFLLKSLIPGEGGTYRWQLNWQVLKERYGDIRGWPFTTETFNGHTVFIAGGLSSYITDSDHKGIRSHFPDASVETIPGVGHWLHAEAREQFLHILRSELS